jgi:hypothetical protein
MQQVDESMIAAMAEDMETFGGLMGPVLDWPDGEAATLENLARYARNTAAGFAGKWGNVGFNFLVQNKDHQVLPGDFNPAKIKSNEGRTLAKRVMTDILREHGIARYAIFADVVTEGDPVPKVMVCAFEQGRSLGWLFSMESLLGTSVPVPEETSAAVSGWWGDLILPAPCSLH